MDRAGVIEAGDVLVIGDAIAAVGPHLEVPDEAVEVDAGGGLLMPGMVDTHRHMWQTALRGLGADWTLTQNFDHGHAHAGNASDELRGAPAQNARVTKTPAHWCTMRSTTNFLISGDRLAKYALNPVTLTTSSGYFSGFS